MSAAAMFDLAALDAHFQATCQRYAHGNGSSHAIAAAALLAVGAPELLEALQRLLELPVAKEELRVLDRGIGTATPNAAWLDARTAIAKAKGDAQ